ncbi:SDR family NAD(P)-dependent oxidoreductase [Gynuella sunshinyii]|uniref:PKS n=1 Tax=Gynuella sunshinyii YC6258 TaxID=1445510 RepID=A0A0C5VNW6_9GAMM|nr:SDR family NAD(P)-dependent oxidoreductase [Gynuella sunshinyii]AJQ95098.1 polyketide synthase modules-related protein [Gynuella sunshinyii YC6258]DAC80073.1 TPA_exp: PKS [Gynuella sunshinyii YC6258]
MNMEFVLDENAPLLMNHQVKGEAIFPAVGYFERLVSELRNLAICTEEIYPFGISNASWLAPLRADNGCARMHLSINRKELGYEYQFLKLLGAETQLCASGIIEFRHSEPEPREMPLDAFLGTSGHLINRSAARLYHRNDIYQMFLKIGIHYKDLFCALDQFSFHEDLSIGRILRNVGEYESGIHVRPDILDAAVQCVLLTVHESRTTPALFVPFSVAEVSFFQKPSSLCYVVVEPHEAGTSDDIYRFNVRIMDESGVVSVLMKDLCVRRYSRPSQNEDITVKKGPGNVTSLPGLNWFITSTFTAEPIQEPLSDWSDSLGWPVNISFAPYNQLYQQLIESSGFIYQNTSGANLILTRLEDFQENDQHQQSVTENNNPLPLDAGISREERDNVLVDSLRMTLPNGLEIAHLNSYESHYLYNEIFVEKTYLKKGITVERGEVVIDIGANIGMFSLFIASEFKEVQIFAFEPSPATYDVLNKNLALYIPNAVALPFGVSNQDGEAEFVFYPLSSVWSGFHADDEQDGLALRQAMENELTSRYTFDDNDALQTHLDALVKERLHKETYQCQLRSLSSFFREYEIEKIGLIKLDAEKCEWDVLQGIEDQDWEKIRQLVVEIHYQDDSDIAQKIRQLLCDKGYEIEVVEEELLKESGLYNLYARRPQIQHAPQPYNVLDGIERNLDALAELIQHQHPRFNVPLFLVLCPPSPAALEQLPAEFCQQMEQRLRAQLNHVARVVSVSDYSELYPLTNYHDPVRQELGDIPYTDPFFKTLAAILVRNLVAGEQAPYKTIVLDCDNTLWSGVVGEAGVEGIEISAEFQALQSFMLAQKQNGMLLCLVSKNNEADVRNVFEQRKDMVLQWDDFVVHQINWSPKSQNLIELSKSLNLALNSFIFVDDSPMECAEVRESCPEVMTLQLPADHTDGGLKTFLQHVWVFDHHQVTAEDRQRTALYQHQFKREQFRTGFDSLKSFIDGLELQVTLVPIDADNVSRFAQLTHRTNQFNINKQPKSAADLSRYADQAGHGCLCFQVSDRFGDYGLCGLILYRQVTENSLLADGFLLSCRALGRGVEYQMLAALTDVASRMNCSTIQFVARQTEKNAPALKFLADIAEQCEVVATESANQLDYQFPVSKLSAVQFMATEPATDPEILPKVSASSDGRQLSSLWIQQVAEQAGALIAGIEGQDSEHQHPASVNTDTLLSDEDSTQSAGDISVAETLVLDHVRRCLSSPDMQIDVNKAFSEYGVDSMAGINLVVMLNKSLDVTLPATTLFDYANVRDLSQFICQEYPQAVTRLQPSVMNVTTNSSNAARTTVTTQAVNPVIDSKVDDIAVVGMSGRFPGIRSPQAFWTMLAEGRSCITEVPADRWDVSVYYDPDRTKENKTYGKWGGFIEEIDRFDAAFFGISGKEAQQMDPQQRLFLEESWHALEDAGYADRGTGQKKWSVFVGADSGDYQLNLRQSGVPIDGSSFMGNDASILAARIAYFMNLKGAAIAIDTASSSSLSAVHMGCASLRSGESDLVIAGGVSIHTTAQFHILCSKAGMLSEDGACKVFDDRADGFVPGEAVGVVILKRLQNARQDRDHIYAVIKGSSINQDGKTNGITAPSGRSQTDLIRQTWDQYGIDPAAISYIESHGTGTRLGDPIEVKALTDAFRVSTDNVRYCALGAVKSNIGHCVHASGVSALLKVLLSLQHGKIAPNRNFVSPNQHIDFEHSPFYINTRLQDWNAPEGELRLAALSSFGFSGTNVHMVVQEYVDITPRVVARTVVDDGQYVFVLSAKNESQLQASARQLQQFLSARAPVDEYELVSLAYTLQVGREAMSHRLAISAATAAELISGLQQYLAGKTGNSIYTGVVQAGSNATALKPTHNSEVVAQAWVLGQTVSWRSLYDDQPYRFAGLPTYPFERERYWLPAQKHVDTLVTKALTEAVTNEIVAEQSASMSGRRTLMPLSTFGAQGKSVSLLQAQLIEPGILQLTAKESVLTAPMMAELRAQLHKAQASPDVKVVILSAGQQPFFSADVQTPAAIPAGFSDLVMACELPVIAAVEGGARGAGWLLACLCDFMIAAREQRYQYSPQPQEKPLSQQEWQFFAERFGEYPADQLLFTDAGLTGQALQELGLQMPVVEQTDVLNSAVTLARDLAKSTRAALVALKQHMSRHLRACADALLQSPIPFSRSPVRATDRLSTNTVSATESWHRVEAERQAMGSGRKIPLSTEVVSAEAYDNGVLQVVLHDRDSRNTFSAAFIDGICEVFRHIQHNQQYKVVVLTGYDHYFASGGTQETLLAIQQGDARFTDDTIFSLALECDVPVIAAMQGHGIGPGWVLGLFCDAMFYSEESVYFSPYMQYGFTPGAGATLIFPSRFGYDMAREILFTARYYKGQDLARPGLLHTVLPRHNVLTAALVTAARLAQTSDRDGLVSDKAGRVAALRSRLDENYALELAMHEKTFVGNDEVRQRVLQHFNQGIPTKVSDVPVAAPVIDHHEQRRQVHEALKSMLADELHLQVSRIEDHTPFIDLGLDSITGVTFIRQVNSRYGLSLTAASLYSAANLTDFTSLVLAEQPRQPATNPPLPQMDTDADDILAFLRRTLADELHLNPERMDDNTPFIDLGLDSITGVTWIRTINAHFSTALGAAELYTHPTLRAFAAFLSHDQSAIVVTTVATTPAPTAMVDDHQTLTFLKHTLAEELHLNPDRIDEDTPFIDLGLDSITGVTFIRRINQHFAQNFGAAELYSHPTLRLFSRFVEQQNAHTEAAPVPPAAAMNVTQDVAATAVVRSEPVSPPSARTPGKPESTAIAVIGMAGQFPQSPSLELFWEHLVAGHDCISEVPAWRWSLTEYYHPDASVPGKTYSRWMGALDDADKFDPLFFNISRREAQLMDPQQRLFLESCWAAIEDAGYAPSALSGSNCGVYVGAGAGDYAHGLAIDAVNAQSFAGNEPAILAARISYLLNLQGPSLALNTACSSSLVAIVSACDSLVSGQCDLALAGGVSVLSGPLMHIMTSKANMLSRHGRCFTFDERADGFVPAEGVGTLLLKRLADAEADGDAIHGVIRGWGTNQDGKTNGITAPNRDAQIRLQQQVYQRFAIHPESIQLVETHGTATRLGDPIEVEGLQRTFQAHTQKQSYCALGSVKSNIGHTLMAAGVASVLKTLLALKHRCIPPVAHFETLNEHINLDHSPFYINREAREWQVNGNVPRRAAVSAFGFSGTNAHVVIDEYRSAVTPTTGRPGETDRLLSQVIVLSARTDEQLTAMVQNLSSALQNGSLAEVKLVDIAVTLQTGRDAMAERLALVADSKETLQTRLQSYLQQPETTEGVYRGHIGQEDVCLPILNEDPEFQHTLVRWVQQQRIAKVLRLWVSGLSIHWASLYQHIAGRRIHLPVYPFARQRYWLDGKLASKTVAPSPLPNSEPIALLEPVWRASPVQDISATDEPLVRHEVFLLGDALMGLAAQMSGPEYSVQTLDGRMSAPDQTFEAAAVALFEYINNTMRESLPGTVLIQVIVSDSLFTGLGALLTSAAQEYSRLQAQLILVSAAETPVTLNQKIRQNRSRPDDQFIRYDQGERQVRELTQRPIADKVMPWRAGGVYLISGGAGGLGLTFAREIATYCNQATIILVGRSDLTPEQQAAIEHVRGLGAQVEYQQLDISQYPAVVALIEHITRSYGHLNGIIHAAGVVRVNAISRKSGSEFKTVLATKVSGTVNLDQATQALDLDFMVLFSSVASVYGDVGLADYACANAFMNDYARYRSQLQRMGQRHGQTLAIVWPLWRNGGMQVTDAMARWLAQNSVHSRAPLTDQQGIEGFYRALACAAPEVIIHSGERIDAGPRPSKAHTPQPSINRTASLQQSLTQVVMQLMALQPEDITDTATFSQMGFDSITLTELSVQLNQRFGLTLTPAVFFEYSTIASVSQYLLKQHPSVFAEIATENGTHETPHDHTLVTAQTPADQRTYTTQPVTSVAIIGISGEFPEADNIAAWWHNLEAEKDCISEAPLHRWDWRSGEHDDSIKWGGFLDGIDAFDPLFFDISPAEAEVMDPQQRLLMTHAWLAIEDAGYAPSSLAGSQTGVFVGTCNSGYNALAAQQGRAVEGYTAVASSPSMGPNRLSYLLDLHGPSEPIDTACSSSLVAIHRAANAIREGRCTLAVSGGVNTLISADIQVSLSKAGALSPDGRCKTFSRHANGYVRSEGVAIVVMKALADAERDGDPIYGVILASGENHGGRANSLTAPNTRAQADLLLDVYRRGNIDPRHISYVEAHGTGTALGDPVEVNALKTAFAERCAELDGMNAAMQTPYCGLGSVKSNIGHLELASGAAGVIKVLLQFKHQRLLKSLHSEEQNPYIELSDSPFFVVRQTQHWPNVTDGQGNVLPRRAAVSSFGFGGVNAHLVLEEYVAHAQSDTRNAGNVPVLVPLSAMNRERLLASVRCLKDWLTDRTDIALCDLAYTLQTGRNGMKDRLGIVVNSIDELLKTLDCVLEDRMPVAGHYRFSGQTASDQDMSGAITQARHGNYEPLLNWWLAGQTVDWSQLYEDNRPRRLNLPGYPFARQRFWALNKAQIPGAAHRVDPVSADQDNDADLLALTPVWQAVPSATAGADTDQHVTVIAPDWVTYMVADTVTVSDWVDVAAILEPDTLQTVLWDCQPIQHLLIHLPQISDGQPSHATVCQLFNIVKAMLALGYGDQPLRWSIVTTQAQPVCHGDIVYPDQAALHGLAGVLAKEYPRWQVQVADLADDCYWPVAELLAVRGESGRAWGYRDRQWYQQVLTPVPEVASSSGYRQGGIYVVIGGSGGIGEQWTRWMQQHWQAQVVWIGRRPLDQALQARLQALAEFGPTPVYLQGDATSAEVLMTLLNTVYQRFGAVHGIIHSAVDQFDRSLAEMSTEQFRTVLRTKVDILLNIDAALAEFEQSGRLDTLDFVLIFSSMASFEKGGGFAGYAAGCLFADACAQTLEARYQRPVKAVNWGYWKVGSGLRVSSEYQTQQQRKGIAPIQPDTALARLPQLLGSSLSQLALVQVASAQAQNYLELPVVTVADSNTGQAQPGADDYQLAAIQPEEHHYHQQQNTLIANILFRLLTDHGYLLTDRLHPAHFPGVSRQYLPWMQATLTFLTAQGLLQQTATGLQVAAAATAVADIETLWSQWQQAQAGFAADKQPYGALIADCLKALPDILSGQIRATDVMFPDGSMERVKTLYQGNRVADLFNRILADTLYQAISSRLAADPDATFRILEVGAGTGGTTAMVLKVLKPLHGAIAEYLYTDLSRSFLLHAQSHYQPEHPFLRTALFDAGQALADQQIPAQHFDFVIAANVLHATANIHQTLLNVKATLRNDGQLLLNELSNRTLWGHVTFGLLEGWWCAEDTSVRIPGSPALTPEGWATALDKAGFGGVQFPQHQAHTLGQQIVVAVRQPLVQSLPVSPVADLQPATVGYLKQLLSKVLKMPVSELDAEEPMQSYGIDSILINQINARLREQFGDIRSTLLFEKKTIAELADYFVTHEAQQLRKVLGHHTDKPAALRITATDDASLSAPAPAPAPTPAPAPAPGLAEPIAVIGISGRYADAEDLSQFWDNLQQGKNCVTDIPARRWSWQDVYQPDPQLAVEQGKSYCRSGSFVGGFDEFDPLFFNLSPHDALAMDPQERLFLQTAWAVLEDAAHTRAMLAEHYAGQVGVFVGVTRTGFDLYGPELRRQGVPFYPRTSFSSMANRLSYFLNIHGPSLPIDTMCSSSLTAVHEACEHLRHGSCRLAIAGGVNLFLHPSAYVELSASGMLSRDGSCKSFAAGANGFVPGEGVGAVLLKPLSAAQADGDNIRALIRSTHVNHDGKTNGYTVPNPNAQTSLIRAALDKAGLKASDISYIEAHGTGTELGDPIEVTGLTLAFSQDTCDTGFCALGSVKSNIGHLEAAAGIAGLSKVILQLQHGKLVPSLHASTLNPNISLSKTPFYLQQSLSDWHPGASGTRMAGVSSFGAGGANAHVIVEEYIPSESESRDIRQPAILLLSARTETALRARAEALLSHLTSQPVELHDLAWTLQSGREAMEQRLAFVADSVADVIARLTAWLKGDETHVLRGRVSANKETVRAMQNDSALQTLWQDRHDRPALETVLGYWIQGAEPDWSQLYQQRLPARLALPTYPFAAESYWLDHPMLTPAGSETTRLRHSLLQENISDFSEQRYRSELSMETLQAMGLDAVDTQAVPALLHVQIAILAARHAMADAGSYPLTVRQLAWSDPVSLQQPVSLHTGMVLKGKGIAFETYGVTGETGSRTVYCQGEIETHTGLNATPVDIEGLRTRLAAVPTALMPASIEACYGDAVSGAHDAATTVLLKLAATRESSAFLFPPTVAESALQLLGKRADQIHRLQSLSLMTTDLQISWVLVRLQADNPALVDLDFCDDHGHVCVRLQGLQSLEQRPSSVPNGASTLMMCQPCWQPTPLAEPASPVVWSRHVILVAAMDDTIVKPIREQLPQAECHSLSLPQQGDMGSRFSACAVQVFEHIKSILMARPHGQQLLQILIPSTAEQVVLRGLAGLLKTAELENPHLIGQLIEWPVDQSSEPLTQIVIDHRNAGGSGHIRYHDDQRLGAVLREQPSMVAHIPWRDNGVYLITGGAGGLGAIFAREIAARTRHARLILTGRRGLDAECQQLLDEITAAGIKAEYRSCDVVDRQAVEHLIADIVERYGQLNGILHGAGLIHDNYILKKQSPEFAAVLAPKVAGLVNLDLASQHLPLDFFVLFSSLSGVMGNSGQSDYAAANAFMDAYADYRNQLHASGARHGKTCSISWSLWQEGGMRISADLLQDSGMKAMKTDEGLQAFYRILNLNQSHMLVLDGERSVLESVLVSEES